MAMPPEGPSAFHESDNERIAAPPLRAEATAYAPCLLIPQESMRSARSVGCMSAPNRYSAP